MAAQSFQSNPITPNHLSGNSSAKNFADGSFEHILFRAQQDIERLFNIPKLKFDFNFSSSNKPDLPTAETENTEAQPINADQQDTSHKASDQKAEQSLHYENKSVEALKEILAANIPIPHPGFMTLLTGTSAGPNNITKSDLQLVINEIVKQAKLVKSGQKTELSLSLSHKDLGEMFLSFALKNGHLAINIAVNAETKKLIEQNLNELELALKESKINLDQIKIVEVKNNGWNKSSG